MPEIVDSIPPRTRRRGSKYDKFFDGPIYRLDPDDYSTRSNVHLAAKTHTERTGIPVTLTQRGDSLYVQGHPDEVVTDAPK